MTRQSSEETLLFTPKEALRVHGFTCAFVEGERLFEDTFGERINHQFGSELRISELEEG